MSIKLRYESIENLPQNRYALISSTNIIVAVVLGKVFFGERITPNQMVGALVIIFGIMYNNIIDLNNPFHEDHITGHFLN